MFGDSADVPTTMIATRDIGVVAADALLSPAPASEDVDLDGPRYTERQVAEELSAALGRPLQVVTVPRPGWTQALVDGGLPPRMAAELAELYDAERRGLYGAHGDRTVTCRTELAETIHRLVEDLA